MNSNLIYRKYQEHALYFLQRCATKPIIALDLDYTLWPLKCNEETLAPYEPLVEQGVVYKNHIRCLDRDTNATRSLSLYPEVRHIIEWCLDHGIILTICSRSPDFGIVRSILEAYDMWDWFLLPQVYNKRKSYHFRSLSEATGIPFHDFLFFDDDTSNVKLCNNMGISSFQVSRTQGLNWDSFLSGLHLFQSNQINRISMQLWLNFEENKTIAKQSSNDDLSLLGSYEDEYINFRNPLTVPLKEVQLATDSVKSFESAISINSNNSRVRFEMPPTEFP
mmetsp:Transcript_17475/g.47832  ORF Transcript_17475/g.47832 Transcript_17475/m.47832 type:complete len:278 (+) Transcript_17475:24-857(+)